MGGSSSAGSVFCITPLGVCTTVHSFTGTGQDGAAPFGPLVLGKDGSFYGTAGQGGGSNEGTVFRLTTAGVLTTVHSFSQLGSRYENADGARPSSGLIQGRDGNFYGTTDQGGSSGSGTIFELTPAGVLTVLQNYGSEDYLIQGSDGNFYGINYRQIFRLNLAGTYTVLHSFPSGADEAPAAAALFQASDGNFYGTTQNVVSHSIIGGTIFRITPAGVFTTLHTFTGNGLDLTPQSSLVQGMDGDLYGGTLGTVYRLSLTPPPDTLQFAAGITNPTENAGSVTLTVQRTGVNAGVVSIDYSESDGTAFTGVDYQAVSGTLTWADGDATDKTITIPITDRGIYNGSTVSFAVNLTNPTGGATLGPLSGTSVNILETKPTMTTLHSFTNVVDNNGGYNRAGLVQGSDGNFYGTTSIGGTNSTADSVFRISSGGVYGALYNFSSFDDENGENADGTDPSAALVQGSDGSFYGTTEIGGSSGFGTVFRITSAGMLTTLHSFTGSDTDGAGPMASLVQGSDGNFYGTTVGVDYQGNSVGGGTIFQITPAGLLTTLHSFTGSGTDGSRPYAGLVQGSDGNLYGTTNQGGRSNEGTVFCITTMGVYNTLYSFTGTGTDGAEPFAGLIQGSDGYFYGTTASGGGGGNGGSGTVFKITPSGVITTLHSFTGSGTDGADPFADLVQGSDGNFYGTTVGGSSTSGYNGGNGTVFRITPAGVFTTLYNFSYLDTNSDNTDGANPVANLIQGRDGNFYGTTGKGGTKGFGTVFKLAVAGSSLLPTVTVTTAGDGMAVEGGEKGKVIVTRAGGDMSTDLVVHYKTKGSAKAGIDFKTPSYMVTIPAGATSAKIKIKPIDNHTVDGTRVAKVKLLPASDGSYEVGDPSLAKIHIIDND